MSNTPAEKTRVAHVDEFADGGGPVIAEVGGVEIGVYRIDGEYHAIANYCVHQGGPLCEGDGPTSNVDLVDGELVYTNEGHVLKCPWHAWKFDVRTGRNVHSDRYSVPTFDVEVVDDEVFVLR